MMNFGQIAKGLCNIVRLYQCRLCNDCLYSVELFLDHLITKHAVKTMNAFPMMNQQGSPINLNPAVPPTNPVSVSSTGSMPNPQTMHNPMAETEFVDVDSVSDCGNESSEQFSANSCNLQFDSLSSLEAPGDQIHSNKGQISNYKTVISVKNEIQQSANNSLGLKRQRGSDIDGFRVPDSKRKATQTNSESQSSSENPAALLGDSKADSITTKPSLDTAVSTSHNANNSVVQKRNNTQQTMNPKPDTIKSDLAKQNQTMSVIPPLDMPIISNPDSDYEMVNQDPLISSVHPKIEGTKLPS